MRLRALPKSLQVRASPRWDARMPAILRPRLSMAGFAASLDCAGKVVQPDVVERLYQRPSSELLPTRLLAQVRKSVGFGAPDLHGLTTTSTLTEVVHTLDRVVPWAGTLIDAITRDPTLSRAHQIEHLGKVVFDTTSRWTDGAVARGAPLEAGVVLLVAGVTLWHLAREGAGFMLKAYGEYFVPQLNTDEHISIHRTLPDAARLQPDQKTHVDPIQAAALIAMAELAVDQLMLSGARLMVALDHYCDLHQKAEALLQYHFYSHPKMAFKYIAYWNGRRFDSWRMENDGRNELTLDWVEHVESDLYDDPDIQALCMLVERLQYKQSFLQEIINSPTGAASAGLDTMT